MEALQDLFTLESLFWLISAILSLIIAKTSIDFISDIKDIFDALKKAVSPAGPGGKKVTPLEQEEIKNEVFDLVYKVWNKYSGGIISFAGKVISKLKFW